jgi:hypothetical protein
VRVSAFAKAERAIDWAARPPGDFIRAIDLAIGIGAFVAARRISEKGARQYPHHEDLQKYALVLAPPRILRVDLPANPGAEADTRWLKKHSLEYRGRWVGLRNGEIGPNEEQVGKRWRGTSAVRGRPFRGEVLLWSLPLN